MMTAVFEAGNVSGATKAFVAPEVTPGNHLAYCVGASSVVDDKVIGAIIYVPGNNITGVTAGKVVNLYELTSENKVVASVAHTLVANEIKN